MFVQQVTFDSVPADAHGLGHLNAAKVSGPQLTQAIRERRVHAEDTNLDAMALALATRIAALDEWMVAHDPQRQSNREAVIEAAASFPLSALSTGIGFEPDGFQEMILFVEELPW